MSRQVPPKIQKLQRALHANAKEAPNDRFYALYDKIYREDILAHAYRLARSNGGQAGVDGERFAQIEEYGVERWLGELAQDRKEKSYRASPVRRVIIPKANGKQRALGIPTIRDRVVQTAAVLVLTPIYEADLQPEQYAYREGRNAQEAVRHVHRLLNTGYTEVVEADLSGYFDTIPHAELMRSVARRISDRHVLALIKQWLVVPVEEETDGGRRKRTTQAKDSKRGIPQGAPISPLLSNLYMRRFVLGWKTLGLEKRLGARIVNYADDFVICCRGTGERALVAMREMMGRLKLTVNEEKTRRCQVPQEHFDFLGYTFGRCYSPKTGRAYIGTRPARKSIRKVCRTISEETSRRWLLSTAEERVTALNRVVVEWANYFSLGAVSNAYRAVDRHASPSRLAPVHPATDRLRTPQSVRSFPHPHRLVRHCCVPAGSHRRRCLSSRSCHTGYRSGRQVPPSLSHEVLAEASVAWTELVSSCQFPVPRFFQHCPRTEAPFLHRHYPVSSVLQASRHPTRPGLALTGCRLVLTRHLHLEFPVLRHSPRFMHAVATSLGAPIALSSPTTAAFPGLRVGRLPHSPFRGLLRVHHSLRPA